MLCVCVCVGVVGWGGGGACVFVYVCIVYVYSSGAGIAQWLERRTRDRKVAGSNLCWSGGIIFFSRVNFLC